MPPLMPPPTRFGSRPWRSLGAKMWRPRMSDVNPGASCSMRSCIRSANASRQFGSDSGGSVPAASPLISRGRWEYAHDVSRSAGARVGSAIDCCPTIKNGWSGIRRCSICARDRVSSSTLSTMCSVPAWRASGGSPRDGTVEVPVDLEYGLVPHESAEVVAHAAREVLGSDELDEEARCVDVGEHRSSGSHLFVVNDDANGASISNDDTLHWRVAHDLAATRSEARHQCAREPSCPALGYRPAVILAEHGEEPTEEPAQYVLGRQVCVQRATGDQALGRIGCKVFAGHLPHWQQREARVPQRIASSLECEPDGRLHRWERRE